MTILNFGIATASFLNHHNIVNSCEYGTSVEILIIPPFEFNALSYKLSDPTNWYINFKLSLHFLKASLTFSNYNLAASGQVSPKVENKLLLREFEYQDPDHDGIYTADVTAPVVDGEYEVITVMDYKDVKIGSKEIRLTIVVDPEGYVYSNVLGGELRIKGALVSLHWLNPDTQKYELWPAEKYQQTNPQTTDKTGRYAFLVPEGMYYLTATAPYYSLSQSEAFAVKEGNGIHINIELKSNNWRIYLLDWRTILLGITLIALMVLCYFIIRGKILT